MDVASWQAGWGHTWGSGKGGRQGWACHCENEPGDPAAKAQRPPARGHCRDTGAWPAPRTRDPREGECPREGLCAVRSDALGLGDGLSFPLAAGDS